MKKKWKIDKKDVVIFFLIFFSIASVILVKRIGNLDEIWNYNFANNIAKGLVPYRDFNMLQTPLLPIITGLILKIVGSQMLVTRILAVLLNTGILFLAYKIVRNLNVNKYFSYIVVVGLFFLLKEHFCLDYNFAVLFLTLIILLWEMKRRKKEEKLTFQFKEDFIIGIIAGLAITLKQSSGIVLAIAVVGYRVLEIQKKEEVRVFLKVMGTRLLGAIVPIFILGIYLIANNAMVDFYDYCILGIQTFSNSIEYSTLWNTGKNIIRILCVAFPIILCMQLIRLIVTKDKITLVLLIYSMASCVVMFPITDTIHFSIGIVVTLLSGTYLINRVLQYLYEKLKEKKKLKKEKEVLIFVQAFLDCILCLAIFLIIVFALRDIVKYIAKTSQYQEIEHFRAIPISEATVQSIKTIDSYMEKQTNVVYILDSDAALYMIPIDRYTKDFDMFLKGNLGSKSEEGQIEKIKNMEKGTQILIKSDKHKRNWQNPENVREYIKNNLTLIGEIEYYSIYMK